jgi:hypothetical protein
MVLLIFVMSSIDVSLTLESMSEPSFVELNPVMGFILAKFGPVVFFWTKVISSFGICVFLSLCFDNINNQNILLLFASVFVMYFLLMIYWVILILKFGIIV